MLSSLCGHCLPSCQTERQAPGRLVFLVDSVISSSWSRGLACFGSVRTFWCWCAIKLWYNQSIQELCWHSQAELKIWPGDMELEIWPIHVNTVCLPQNLAFTSSGLWDSDNCWSQSKIPRKTILLSQSFVATTEMGVHNELWWPEWERLKFGLGGGCMWGGGGGCKYLVIQVTLTVKCWRSFWDHSVHFRFSTTLYLKNGWWWRETDQTLGLRCKYLIYTGYFYC